MATIDLDALVGIAEPITITWKGESFRLADDLDLEAVRPVLRRLEQLIAEDDAADDAKDPSAKKGLEILDTLRAFVQSCFYDEATFERFTALRPGPQVLMALVRNIPKTYGFESLGESSASSGGSPDTGTESTPTSDGSIPGSSTPPEVSGAAWPTTSGDLGLIDDEPAT